MRKVMMPLELEDVSFDSAGMGHLSFSDGQCWTAEIFTSVEQP